MKILFSFTHLILNELSKVHSMVADLQQDEETFFNYFRISIRSSAFII